MDDRARTPIPAVCGQPLAVGSRWPQTGIKPIGDPIARGGTPLLRLPEIPKAWVKIPFAKYTVISIGCKPPGDVPVPDPEQRHRPLMGGGGTRPASAFEGLSKGLPGT